MSKNKFPDNFMWGTAISAYQSEGNNFNNDWYYYEQEELKKPEKYRKILEPCGISCDHWNRYEGDFELAKEIGIQIHRLSIEWSRVFPQKDKVDNDALEHYKNMLLALKKKNIKVMLCLHHFTIPKWLVKMGGYMNGNAVIDNYSKYITTVVDFLGADVDYWLTMNEPNVIPTAAYMIGLFPPFKKNPMVSIKIFRTFIRMHAEAYGIIKGRFPNTQVSCSYLQTGLTPYNPYNPIDRLMVYHGKLFNQRFFDGIKTGRLYYPLGLGDKIDNLKGSLDFIGLNYFYRVFAKGFAFTDIDGNDFHGAYMGEGLFYPEGLYQKIKQLYRILKLPIIVTENGTPTNDETFRIKYLEAHIKEVYHAIQEGIPVIGYMVWSLLDNFEWQQGYKERFGLIHVDYKTQKRTIKKSGKWFSRVIKTKEI